MSCRALLTYDRRRFWWRGRGWLPDQLPPTFTCDVDILMSAQKSEDGVGAMTELLGFLAPSAGGSRTLPEVAAVDIAVRAVRRPAQEYGWQSHLKGACASNMQAHEPRHLSTGSSLLTSHQGETGSIPGRLTPGSCKWESCRAMPLFGGIFSLIFRPPPPPIKHSGAAPYSPRFTIINSSDPNVENHPNLSNFTRPKRVIEMNLEQRREEELGETVDPRENPSTNGIARHDAHMRESGVTRPGIQHGSPWWEASRLNAQPPWRHDVLGRRVINGKTARQFRASRVEAMGELMRMPRPPLALPRFQASDVQNSSNLEATLIFCTPNEWLDSGCSNFLVIYSVGATRGVIEPSGPAPCTRSIWPKYALLQPMATEIGRCETPQSSAYWSLSCVFIGCCPAPGSYGIRKVFSCKSAIGSEAWRAILPRPRQLPVSSNASLSARLQLVGLRSVSVGCTGGHWLLPRAPRMYSTGQAPAYLATLRHTLLIYPLRLKLGSARRQNATAQEERPRERDRVVGVSTLPISLHTDAPLADCKTGPGSPLVDDRPVMNAGKYRVVLSVVWTNRTMVNSNTDTNRTGILAVVDIEVSLLASHQREPGSIFGRVTGISQVGIVKDFNSGAAPYSPQSPSSTLKTTLSRAIKISSLTSESMERVSVDPSNIRAVTVISGQKSRRSLTPEGQRPCPGTAPSPPPPTFSTNAGRNSGRGAHEVVAEDREIAPRGKHDRSAVSRHLPLDFVSLHKPR
ncbi:hypothetical protein PR048_030719 [Dryococelus australis]|uniref:Uncharacterized protein n=1 Tax=Dryococelus australis TaxID=614101 RepID=A0ABQ9G9S5_9NEOP|nr:hypothetical protein PR048_030719 [Dryococelus australis]